MNTKRLLGAMAWILVLGFGFFEIFNTVTTYTSLNLFLGSWFYAVVLTGGIGLTDIGGLFRVVTPAISDKDEPIETKLLFGAWIVIAAVNAILTWWGLSYAAEHGGGVTPSAISQFRWVIPIALAVTIFGIRLILIYMAGNILDRTVNNHRPRPMQPASRPGTIAPRPQGQTIPGLSASGIPLRD
jgi:hypothetical protein